MADSREYDVIIIGGGATGAGIARDCALRGLKAALVERYDIATGATGRNHGLLHSGARYAVTDSESARECISENRILRRIARHCIEPTSGLFITLPEDDPAYQHTFITACQQAGIEAQPLTPAEALRIEPAVNPALLGAVQVPDGTVDPFPPHRRQYARCPRTWRRYPHRLRSHRPAASGRSRPWRHDLQPSAP
jgi:glycerol-3-phosphate dehydrogenase